MEIFDFFKSLICRFGAGECRKTKFSKFSKSLENFKNFSYLKFFHTISGREDIWTSIWPEIAQIHVLTWGDNIKAVTISDPKTGEAHNFVGNRSTMLKLSGIIRPFIDRKMGKIFFSTNVVFWPILADF